MDTTDTPTTASAAAIDIISIAPYSAIGIKISQKENALFHHHARHTQVWIPT
jgi:hypothetical protein